MISLLTFYLSLTVENWSAFSLGLYLQIITVQKCQFNTILFLKSNHCNQLQFFPNEQKQEKIWLKPLAYCTQLAAFVVFSLSISQILATLSILQAICWASPLPMPISGKDYTIFGICYPINNKVPIFGKRSPKNCCFHPS